MRQWCEPGGGTGEKAGASLAAIGGEELGIGETRGVIDSHVQMLPTDSSRAMPWRSPVMRWPMPSMRPSFLVSTWISSPGLWR